MNRPRLVIAATRSGDGKTTVATGLMAALRAAGHRVSAHKVGPDYIDPSYHAAATGGVGRNLDPWMVGEDLIAPLFQHGAAEAEISVIEGVMGLYDGVVGREDFASTAHVARLLDAPIVLVIGAAGTSRSIAATVHGFATFDPRVRLAGVVLNQISSERHEQTLRDALGQTGIPVLGALPAAATLHTPSRHLGLVPVGERPDPVGQWLPELRAMVETHIDLPQVVSIANAASAMPGDAWSPDPSGPSARATIAVAGGAAFTFGYAEHVELLSAAGADVVSFDPMTDEQLPAGTDAVVIGGGFPEIYLERLTANTSLRAEIRERAAAGMPVVAECAGLLWLGEELDGAQQCGVLPSRARMTPKLTLGYREAEALTDNPIVRRGTVVRGHEFHRTVVEPPTGEMPAWRFADGSQHGWAGETMVASYLHLHWAGVPGAAARLVQTAVAQRAPA
ncbi:MAG TPA: cobyrinate a,c-diamide synthase [Mycobacteriales bacterium]|nr:cobyrinate a,c-diamide synthase [Mycobacteriales bacterium]